MHFDINPLCDSLKKQLRSLSRRDIFYLLTIRLLSHVTSNGRPSLLILREGPVTGAAGNGGPCSSSFSGSWLMLGEAGSDFLVPASRWSTATPGEAGVDDGDGDWAALILLSLRTSCRRRWTCPSSSADERSQFGVKRSSSRRDESNTDVNRRTSSS